MFWKIIRKNFGVTTFVYLLGNDRVMKKVQ